MDFFSAGRLRALALVCLMPFSAAAAEETAVHGLSMYGDLKYAAGFKHFDYVNPDAPKSGALRYAALGAFDNLNPFIVKGVAVDGAAALTYDSLAVEARDEPFSMYGLLAESFIVAKDLSFVEFTLRQGARWHDGKPVTPEDVIFSMEILKEKGAPLFRHYYANVTKAEKVGERRVRFSFDVTGNRELPLIVGQLPILPKHYWQGRDFAASTMEPPLGSGPYRLEKAELGRSAVYVRVADYWGRDLAVNRGRFNFERIEFQYYRDDTVALEAFKADKYDIRVESSAKNWATAYDFPASRQGRVVKTEITLKTPAVFQGFYLNLRKDKFADARVREALSYAFDFDWSNKTIFFSQYVRTKSYFDRSELASSGLPSAAELTLLEPYRDRLPPRLFTEPYAPPATSGTEEGARANLRQAARLLREAGWTTKDGKLVSGRDGRAMEIEFLINSPLFERVIAPFIANLEKLGISAAIRLVEDSQFVRRTDIFDFDIVVGAAQQSLSPGNEQREYWGSAAADQEGSRNLMGIKNPVVDALIEKIVFAPDRASLVAATRALDRVLLWSFYAIPQYYAPSYRIAHWDRFDKPAIAPAYGLGFLDTWWFRR